MPETKFATCMLCEASCGVKVTVEQGRQLRIEGDAADPFSRGHICPKVTALEDVRLDPDRLTQPMRRDRATNTWQPIGWDEALELAAEKLSSIRLQHGPHAVATYAGNPMVHSYTGVLGGTLLIQALGSYSRFSATSVDQLPHMLVAWELFGHQLRMPVPDLDRTQFLLVMGANPAVSNGSIMTAPDVKQRLKALRARGGKLVVIDPRRTETAALADQHLFITPGTDALLLLAMLQVLFDEQRTRVPPTVLNVGALAQAAADFPPERVEQAVGIPAAQIRALARDFAAAPSAASYPRMGACTQEFGGLTAFLAIALDAVTGNLDAVGGKMFTTPAADLVAFTGRLGMQGGFARFKTRVRGLPEFGGELPVAALAEEIRIGGDKRIRALVTSAGNPVLSTPNGRALDEALGTLDFMVSIDLYLNETTRHADLILPPSFGLERDHYDLVLYLLAIRNVARYAPAVFEPAGQTRHDFDIATDLALRVARRRKARALTMTLRAARALGPRRILDLLLRLGPHRTSLSKVARSTHGLDFGALQAGRLQRPVDLAAKTFLGDVPRLNARLAPRPEGLRLIGRRALRSNNSWLHNSARLTRGANLCTLLMHPADASARALKTGAWAEVTSRTGALRIQVEVTDGIAPGVVSIPHGWGHDRQGAKLGVARERAGVSANDLTDETFLDALTANAGLNGVPVEVSAVRER